MKRDNVDHCEAGESINDVTLGAQTINTSNLTLVVDRDGLTSTAEEEEEELLSQLEDGK